MANYDKTIEGDWEDECYMMVALKFDVDRAITEMTAEKIDETLAHAWIHGRDMVGATYTKGARTSLNYIERDGKATITYIIDVPKDITADHLQDVKLELTGGISLDLDEVQVSVTSSAPDDSKWFTIN